MKRKIAFILVLIMCISCGQFPVEEVAAAKKMSISKKKVTLKVGKKVTLKIKNKKGKVTWKSTKKKIATVTKKGVVKAKKKGKANIIATVKYKGKKTQFKCKVTVKNADKKKITVTPSATPVATPTVTPTQTATAILTADVDFIITAIDFANEELEYELSDKKVFVETASDVHCLKEKVSDISKCTFEGELDGTTYKDLKPVDFYWNDEPYYSNGNGGGYYGFNLCVKAESGITYKIPYVMIEKKRAVDNDETGAFRLNGLSCDGEAYTLMATAEKNVYTVDVPEGRTLKETLEQLENAEFSATWGKKVVSITKITNVNWYEKPCRQYSESHMDEAISTGYYEFTIIGKNAKQNIVQTVKITDKADTFSIAGVTGTLSDFQMKIGKDNVLACVVPEGKTLREYLSNPKKQLTFTCQYQGAERNNVQIINSSWKSKKDSYYIQLSLTEDGEEIVQTYQICEDKTKNYITVTGTVSSNLTETKAGVKVVFRGEEEYTTESDDKGAYSIRVPAGKYQIEVMGIDYDKVTVDKKNCLFDIRTLDFCIVKGTLSRNSSVWSDTKIIFSYNGTEDYYRTITARVNADGSYVAYLPKDSYTIYSNDWKRLGSLQVTGNMEYDIKTTLCEVRGKVVDKNIQPVVSSHLCAKNAEGDGETLNVDMYGRFTEILEANQTYNLYLSWDSDVSIGTLEVGEDDLKTSISTSLVVMSGTLKNEAGEKIANSNIRVRSAEGKKVSIFTQTDKNGKYNFTLPVGTYKISNYLSYYVKKAFSETFVVDGTTQKDIIATAVYKVYGKVMNYGKKESEYQLGWEAYSKKLKTYQSVWHQDLVTNDNGEFCVYLKKGKYKINGEKVKVTDSNVELNLEITNYGPYKLKGYVYAREDIVCDNISGLRIYNSKGTFVTSLSYSDMNEDGSYQCYVKEADIYSIRWCTEDGYYITVGSVEIKEETTRCNINLNAYEISGYCLMPNEDASVSYRLYDEAGRSWDYSTSGYWEGDQVWSGFYAYVPAGTYTVKMKTDSENEYRVVDTIVVTDADVLNKQYK